VHWTVHPVAGVPLVLVTVTLPTKPLPQSLATVYSAEQPSAAEAAGAPPMTSVAAATTSALHAPVTARAQVRDMKDSSRSLPLPHPGLESTVSAGVDTRCEC